MKIEERRQKKKRKTKLEEGGLPYFGKKNINGKNPREREGMKEKKEEDEEVE